MASIKRTFIKGLITIIPITATIFLLVWLFQTTEKLLADTIKNILPSNITYIPGMGLIFVLVIIFVVGFILNAWIARQLLSMGERFLGKIPLIKTIYNSVKDITAMFSQPQGDIGKVVTVDIGKDRKLVGFVTRDDLDGLNLVKDNSGYLAIYLPMSYQIGGYTVLLPKNQVTELDIPAEKALSQTVTGWLTAQKEEPKSK